MIFNLNNKKAALWSVTQTVRWEEVAAGWEDDYLWPSGERPSLESYVMPPMHSLNPEYILSSIFFLFFFLRIACGIVVQMGTDDHQHECVKQWQLIQQESAQLASAP